MEPFLLSALKRERIELSLLGVMLFSIEEEEVASVLMLSESLDPETTVAGSGSVLRASKVGAAGLRRGVTGRIAAGENQLPCCPCEEGVRESETLEEFACGEIGRDTGLEGPPTRKSDQEVPRSETRFRGIFISCEVGHPKAAETLDEGIGRVLTLSKEAIEDGRGDTGDSKRRPGSIGSKEGLKGLNAERRECSLFVRSNPVLPFLNRLPCKKSRLVAQLPCDPLRRRVPIGSSPGS